MLLRLRLATTISSSQQEIKKSNTAAEGWKFRYFELKNIAEKMIEQHEHESNVQKDVIDKMMNEKQKPIKSAKSIKTVKSDTNEKEHERMEQLSNERQKQVDNVRRAALIETKMRLNEREKDLAELNALMIEQQSEHDSRVRKQAKMVEQAAQRLSQERMKKLAAYDNIEKLQLQLDESRRVQSSLGNYSPRSTVQLSSRPKSAIHSDQIHSSLSPLLKKRQSVRQNSIF